MIFKLQLSSKSHISHLYILQFFLLHLFDFQKSCSRWAVNVTVYVGRVWKWLFFNFILKTWHFGFILPLEFVTNEKNRGPQSLITQVSSLSIRSLAADSQLPVSDGNCCPVMSLAHVLAEPNLKSFTTLTIALADHQLSHKIRNSDITQCPATLCSFTTTEAAEQVCGFHSHRRFVVADLNDTF